MKVSNNAQFNQYYSRHLKHLKLKGLQPKTVCAYARAIRRLGDSFDHCIDQLSQDQLLDYFSARLEQTSWSTVKLDLYGVKFFYLHVLQRDWLDIPVIKPPKRKRIPDIITASEAQLLFMATRKLSYRVLFFTLYSLGLRLSEGLRLEVGDIDANSMRVHVRDAKGNKDRLVPLPQNTLRVLRRFWGLHQHSTLLFPNRKRGLGRAHLADSPLDKGGVQCAMAAVVKSMGLKKRLVVIRCAIVTQRICWRPEWIFWRYSNTSAIRAC